MQELKIPKYGSIRELLRQDFGYCDNVFFGNNEDWTKVIFMFNGAVTQKKLEQNLESAVFQRWSWYDKFKHPVFCIADPLTFGEGRIPLAWYQGKTQGVYLREVLLDITTLLDEKLGAYEKVAFGSSGGGFAALLCAQLGLVDSAIAVNPQTDILKFHEKSALNAFLNQRRVIGMDSNCEHYSLVETGFVAVKKNCRITYLQNTCDRDHFAAHMRPYISAALTEGDFAVLNLHCFTDPEMGHNPPPLQVICEIVGREITQLLK